MRKISEILFVMEQKQRQDAESSSEPWPVITQTEFFEQITVDTYDRFALVFSYLILCTNFKTLIAVTVTAMKKNHFGIK